VDDLRLREALEAGRLLAELEGICEREGWGGGWSGPWQNGGIREEIPRFNGV